jgi:CheY-like chemotaxis protein
MEGSLRVQSAVGRGSTFSVELPLAEAPAPAVDVLPQGVVAHGDDACAVRLTVLYIEDNLSNLRLVERVLARRPGITLLSALQGRVGLALARDHQPDLILLDRHLPDLLGDDVLRALIEDSRTCHIPVVMLSADASATQIQRLLAAGARSYLTKPLDITALLKLVDDLPAR